MTILPDGEGYTINFVSGKTINIYNGRNGTNGSDGKDGKDGRDGKNGVTPVISVKKDIEGQGENPVYRITKKYVSLNR